jgi:hypothetical protein
MANYLLLIYRDESAPQPDGSEVSSPYLEFMTRQAEVLRGGAALEASSTATSLRPGASNGPTVTDGPFAESKEVLGGYWVIEAADLDEALAIAKQVPMPDGGIEVRPIRMMS